MVNTTRYHCINKRCKQYHKEVLGTPPAEFRRMTGRRVSCCKCGLPLRWLGEVKEEKHG